jgi:DNA modification methylase
MPSAVYGRHEAMKGDGSTERYPRSVQKFDTHNSAHGVDHPTQKPVALYEYLIRTYTNAGETVLDFTMGSSTTGVAAIRTGRNFIGVEKDAGYFAIAQRRCAEASLQPALFQTDAPKPEQAALL